MKTSSLETRLGIFVALALLAAFLIIEVVGGLEWFRSGYRLHALFDTAQELKVGDPVKMAGVEVGRVDAIDLVEGQVRVTMKIRPEAEVKTDSVASIKFTGLLGQNFVAIAFGSPEAPRAVEGAVLNTTEQPDLSTLMARLDSVAVGVENLTRSFTGERIENLLGPFTDFLQANHVPLTAMIANMRDISTQVAEGKGTVGRLIYEETLYNAAMDTVGNLQDATEEIRLAVGDARQVVDRVNAGEGSIGKLITDETLYRETTDSMTALREILQKINRGEGAVGTLINDDALIRNARLTLQKLDKATEGLEDQGPLSVLGILVNGLF